MLFATGISAITGLRNFVELCFSLSLIALLSMLVFQLSAARNLDVESKPERVRVFKRGTAEVTLSVHKKGWSWFGMSSATVRSGKTLTVEPRVVGFAGGTFAVTGRSAGRHETLELDVTLSDILGLFRLNKVIKVQSFVAEVLPSALRYPPPMLATSGVSVGEASGGRRGTGQEMYAIEGYGPDSERRDIIWKRVARQPDAELMSRIREANLPESVDVCLLEGRAEDRENWMDLSSEALAQIGVDLLGLGIGLVVPYHRGTYTGHFSAYTRDELEELAVAIWQPGISLQMDRESMSTSRILIVSEEALGPEVAKIMSDKPTVIISSTRGIQKKDGPIVFSGREDLSPVVLQVVGQ